MELRGVRPTCAAGLRRLLIASHRAGGTGMQQRILRLTRSRRPAADVKRISPAVVSLTGRPTDGSKRAQ